MKAFGNFTTMKHFAESWLAPMSTPSDPCLQNQTALPSMKVSRYLDKLLNCGLTLNSEHF